MKRTILAMGMAIFSGGCASGLDYMQPANAPAAADAGHATVVFVRPGKMAPAVKVAVADENGALLARLGPSTCATSTVTPGEHYFVGSGEGYYSMKAELEAGKIYYVWVKPLMGAMRARFALEGMGPSREGWSDVPGALAKCEHLTVAPDGAAQFKAERGEEELRDWIAKGIENFAGYDAEYQQTYSLAPADGVQTPIAPAR